VTGVGQGPGAECYGRDRGRGWYGSAGGSYKGSGRILTYRNTLRFGPAGAPGGCRTIHGLGFDAADDRRPRHSTPIADWAKVARPDMTLHSSTSSIAILFNSEHLRQRGEARDEVSSRGVTAAVEAVETALAELGRRPVRVPLGDDALAAMQRLRMLRPELVINLCEAFGEEPEGEMDVAGLLEIEGWTFTGAPALTLGLCVDKGRTRALLAAAGLPVPRARILSPGEAFPRGLVSELGGQVILKPLREDASLGLDDESVTDDDAPAARRAEYLHRTYRQPALVEEYIDGRELNVALLGEAVLAIAEIDFQLPADRPRILSYAAKWDPASPEYRQTMPVCPARVDEAFGRRLGELAVEAARVLGLRDYGRVDFRVHRIRGPLIIDVNPNPDLAPDAGYTRALASTGRGLREMLQTLIERARGRRAGGPARGTFAAATGRSRPAEAGLTVRGLVAGDRPGLAALLERTPQFRPDEVAVALELIDVALDKPDQHDYRFRVVVDERQQPLGYACYGPTPMADGVHDLYWIVVDPDHQGRSLGRRLVEAVEADLASAPQARLLIIETSSTGLYDSTRGFYHRIGCHEMARLVDFYRVGDDKVIYAKPLGGRAGEAPVDPAIREGQGKQS
jgi:D-alanine-D-alanine ligase